jgi:hypothetical protein
MQDLLSHELKYRLPIAVQYEIQELANNGWEFTKNYWESGHNGDSYNDVKFKSPAMSVSANISEHDWNTHTTKEDLLNREAEAVACGWAKTVEDDLDIFGPLSKKLKTYFLKRKDCNFGKLGYGASTVTLRISPQVKNKPKKIRVTVEIL